MARCRLSRVLLLLTGRCSPARIPTIRGTLRWVDRRTGGGIVAGEESAPLADPGQFVTGRRLFPLRGIGECDQGDGEGGHGRQHEGFSRPGIERGDVSRGSGYDSSIASRIV